MICGGNTTVEPVAISRTIETEEAVYLFSVGGDLNTAIRLHAVAGATSSAAISFGGEDGTNVPTNATEKYNGTAWAVDNNLNVAVKYCGAAGTASAGLCGGGGNAVQSMNTQEYNGTVWSVGGNLNTHVGAHGMCGTQTCAISFGGQAGGGTSITAETEEYNGSAWSTSGIGDLNTARWYHEGGGRTHGFTTGGLAPGLTGETEEYR